MHDLLLQMDPYNFGRPNEINSRVKGWADVIMRILSVHFQSFGESRRVLVNGKLANVIIFKMGKNGDLGNGHVFKSQEFRKAT